MVAYLTPAAATEFPLHDAPQPRRRRRRWQLADQLNLRIRSRRDVDRDAFASSGCTRPDLDAPACGRCIPRMHLASEASRILDKVRVLGCMGCTPIDIFASLGCNRPIPSRIPACGPIAGHFARALIPLYVLMILAIWRIFTRRKSRPTCVLCLSRSRKQQAADMRLHDQGLAESFSMRGQSAPRPLGAARLPPAPRTPRAAPA